MGPCARRRRRSPARPRVRSGSAEGGREEKRCGKEFGGGGVSSKGRRSRAVKDLQAPSSRGVGVCVGGGGYSGASRTSKAIETNIKDH